MKPILFGFLFSFLVSACHEDEFMNNPYGNLSKEGICFGVSKGAVSWKPDSRALLEVDTIVLASESMDVTFGMSVVVKEQESTLQSRGMQTTSKESLTEFDVSAFYYKAGAATAELYFEEEVTDGENTAGGTYYWPWEGTMDFFAVAPRNMVNPMPTVEDYNENSVSFDYSVSENVTAHKDVMVANSLGLNKETGRPVWLTFKHLLASVRFVVGDMQFIKIESLSIENVYGGTVTFTYDKQQNAWASSAPTTIVSFTPDFVDTSGLPKGAEIAGNVNNATMFMIPQTLPQDAEVKVSYTALLTGEKKSGTVKIGGQKWEAGKDYAYTFNIGTKFDVTIPTPKDQDAHYIMLEMPYQLGELSSYVKSIKATASFWEDGSNTSTKSGISLMFKEDLSETQKLGFWTDARYVETITVNNSGESSSSGITKEADIRGGGELSIGNKLSGFIVLFIEENNGMTDRNGKLEFKATLNNGTEVVIGQGNFKQLCPSWNNQGVGVERIEDTGKAHPYGFDYNRTVVYTNPGNDWWLLKELGCILYSWGASSFITDDEGDFITLGHETWWVINYINTVTLNYGALNDLNGVASDIDGLVNTRSLYNFTGNSDFSTIETNLDNNLNWSKQEADNSEDIPEDYAAFVALSRNRMYEMKTIVNGNRNTEITYKPILYKDISTNEDIIEWYLPSSEEAGHLKETGTSAQGISPLDGNYWSSTAGNDANAYAYSYTFNNNVFGGINESASRMTEYKVRAVRKKP